MTMDCSRFPCVTATIGSQTIYRLSLRNRRTIRKKPRPNATPGTYRTPFDDNATSHNPTHKTTSREHRKHHHNPKSKTTQKRTQKGGKRTSKIQKNSYTTHTTATAENHHPHLSACFFHGHLLHSCLLFFCSVLFHLFLFC